jgi:DNA polymerase I-like protein with 3'-5' exonuclease and polymerase domains
VVGIKDVRRGMTLIFDIETDGLLEETTKIHSLVIYDTEKDELYSCHSGVKGITDGKYYSIEAGISMLEKAEEIAGHNIIKFDLPVIQKLYPTFWTFAQPFDTLLMSKLVYPDVGEIDDRNIRKGTFPKNLRGKYSLKAWGYRLKEYKGDYCEQEDCWAEWSADMQRYCEQDVMVTKKLFELLKSKNISEEARKLEHQFAFIIFGQEQRGVYFDKEKAVALASKLTAEKLRIEEELKKVFPNKIVEETFIPKVNNKTKGYVKGQPFTKKIEIEFNPQSRQMIAEALIERYGWKPTELSPTGLPVINEEVIDSLDYPEAPLIKEYFLVTKTLGQLADGKNAWLKLVSKDGAIHGYVDTIGAVTGRCTHNSPNLAQVPAVGGFMGKECRELFRAREGYKLVGCDASGLELRCLAHYMNDEDYTYEILHGDIHTKNQQMAGLATRAEAKRFIYAFNYGGGDSLIGSIVGGTAKDGKKIKERFLNQLPKLHTLIKNVQKRIKERSYLKGIDGRILKVREQYKGLNVLLQSCGAIVMKKALCILFLDCLSKGWKLYGNNPDVAFVLNVHDEYQAEVKPELVEKYKVMAVEAIRKAGEYFHFRCPLDGEAKVGDSWYDTH